MDENLMNTAIEYLRKDPVMAELIYRYGILQDRTEEVDLFTDLVETIISQQLSEKAGGTIVERFRNGLGTGAGGALVPDKIWGTRDDQIREWGISFSKIKYIKGLTKGVIDGSVDLENLRSLSDEDVIKELIKLNGVGPWTAEMFLVFSLGRADVFSIGDLGLRTAVGKLYGMDREDLKKIEEISLKWKPYRSMASRYLWKSLDNK